MNSPSKLGKVLKYIDKITGGVKPKSWLFKFLPLVVLQTMAVFAYTILKNSKNSIVTRVSPTITFNWLKILVITPFALLFPLLVKKIMDILKNRKEKVPYVLMGLFIGIYVLFALVIFPFGNVLQFPWLVDLLPKVPLLNLIPSAILNGISNTFGYWGNSIFYGLAEMWAAIGINFLAWGIANDICDKNESKIFYPAFGVLSNFGAWYGSNIMLKSNLSGLSEASFAPAIRNIIFAVCTGIGIMLLTYWFIERFVMKDPNMMPHREVVKKSKPENGLQMVMKSPYLQKIAMMVCAYALIIFLVEQCWYPTIIEAYGLAAFTPVTAKVGQINAKMTIILSIFSTFLLSHFSWAVTAMIPVIMAGASAIGFFVCYFMGQLPGAVGFLASSGLMTILPIQLAVIIGSFQNISSRSGKYSIFDSRINELYRSSPDSDIRTQGKAAVDVAFGKTAKSCGSTILVVLISIHSVYVGLRGHLFPHKTHTAHESTHDTKNQGKLGSEEIARNVVKVELEDDGRYKLIVADPSKIEHKNFEKDTDFDGNITFTQKATEVSSKSHVEHATPIKKESDTRDVIPAIFVIVLICILLWGYAVITIAPMYEANLIEPKKSKSDLDSDEEPESEPAPSPSPSTRVNPFNATTITQLIVLTAVISGSLYFWVSREITVIVSKVDTTNIKRDPAAEKALREKLMQKDG